MSTAQLRLAYEGAQATKSDVFGADPRALTLITDKAHPLYDKRVDLPLKESMLASVRQRGIIKPIVIRFNGDVAEVVAGRRRVKHALAILAEQIAAGVTGKELLKVPCMVKRLSDQEAVEVMIEENEEGLADTLSNKAHKANRLLELTQDEAYVAGKFKDLHGNPINLQHLLAILELAPRVQQAIDDGELPLSAAPEMALIRREHQPAKLEELISAGLNRGSNVKRAIREVAAGKDVKEISTFKGLLPSRMKALAIELTSDKGAGEMIAAQVKRWGADQLVGSLLLYAAGDQKALDRVPELLELIGRVDAALTKKGVITGSAKAKKTRAEKEAQPAKAPAKKKARK